MASHFLQLFSCSLFTFVQRLYVLVRALVCADTERTVLFSPHTSLGRIQNPFKSMTPNEWIQFTIKDGK